MKNLILALIGISILLMACRSSLNFSTSRKELLTVGNKPFKGSRNSLLKVMNCQCIQPDLENVAVLENEITARGKTKTGYAIYVQDTKKYTWKRIDFLPHDQGYSINLKSFKKIDERSFQCLIRRNGDDMMIMTYNFD